MNSSFPASSRLAFAWVVVALFIGPSRQATALDWPPVGQISARLKAVAPQIPEPAAGESDPTNYLRSLAPLVLLPESLSAPAVSSSAELLRTNLYDGPTAYFRLGSVTPDSAARLREAVEGLVARGHAGGYVLDLRFLGGSDFSAALSAASPFAAKEAEVLRLGTSAMRVTRASSPPAGPVILLVNSLTRGAAEALATAVRATASNSLTIGTNTAGQGRAYRDVELADGLSVKVAAEPLIFPDGRQFPVEGLKPDLTVTIPGDDELRYFTNAFAKPTDGRSVRTPPAFRLNEAELVRQMRGARGRGNRGVPPGSGGESAPGTAGAHARRDLDAPVAEIQDPALARALDLISGWTVAKSAPVGEATPGDSR